MDNNIKWAVVCINQYDCDVQSVDLFESYESAQEFMQNDADNTYNDVVANNDDCDACIQDYGQSVTLYVDNEPENCWCIVPTNTH